jgi:hypothetical protein
MAGFDVVAAICLEEVFQQALPNRFEVAIVGHGFSLREKAEFVRCIQKVLRLPVILIAEGQLPGSLRADVQVAVDAPKEILVWAINHLLSDKGSAAIAV